MCVCGGGGGGGGGGLTFPCPYPSLAVHAYLCVYFYKIVCKVLKIFLVSPSSHHNDNGIPFSIPFNPIPNF